MAQTFILLLGEIDLSVGFNAAIGGLITVWMVSINNPYPVWVAILAGLAISAAISAIEGLIVVWLKIPSFVVTLAGLLGLNGVLIWLFEKTGSVGQGGSISLRPGFLNDLVNGNMSPATGWIVLIAAVAVGGLFLIMRDRRRHSAGLVAPPLGVTLLKIGAAAAIGAVLVLVLNVNRAAIGVLQGVPWVVPIVLVLLVATIDSAVQDEVRPVYLCGRRQRGGGQASRYQSQQDQGAGLRAVWHLRRYHRHPVRVDSSDR